MKVWLYEKNGLLWEKVLCVQIGLMLYELAAQSSFFLMETSLMLLFVCFVWEERKALFSPLQTAGEALGLLRPLGGCWMTVVLYLGWEVLSFSRSVYPFGIWEKYRVVLLMLGISALTVWYLRKDSAVRLRRLMMVFAAAGTAAAVLSVLNAFVPVLYPLVYGRRLSLRLDYNLFSQVVLFGLIAGEYLCARQPQKVQLRLGFWLVCAPVVVLSSSRRNTIFLLCFFVWRSSVMLFSAQKGKRARLLGKLCGGVVAVVLLVVGMQQLLDWQDAHRQQLPEGSAVAGQTSALERYAVTDSGGSKRWILWSLALREYQQYPVREELVGKGFGFDVFLYQITDDRALLEAYEPQSRSGLSAHCFVLTDLLNVGAIGAALGVAVWLFVAAALWKLWRSGSEQTMFFCITLGITLANNLISNRYGFLYDKYFWLLLCMLGAALPAKKKRLQR